MTASGNGWRIEQGDVIERLRAMPDNHFHCCVTSPPYWGLRDYGVDGQIGLEKSLGEFIGKMTEVFSEVWRVLRDDGVLWVNMGDGYASGGGGSLAWSTPTEQKKKRVGQVMPSRISIECKPKDLLGQPWRLAFALQDFGWYLRQEIIWHKPAPMPESVRDRCTKAHEQIFLLTKKPRYYFDCEAVKVPSTGRESGNTSPGKYTPETNGIHRTKANLHKCVVLPFANLRSVWTLSPEPFAQAHFATFPTELPRRCILAGTSEHGCCAECGVPWVRVVETERTFQSGSGRSGNNPIGKNGIGLQGGGATVDVRRGPCVTSRTTGWQPSCECNAEIVPCRVLDPFSGAGTTVMVARRLHRHAVGIELNPEYVEMSRKRILDDAPLFN